MLWLLVMELGGKGAVRPERASAVGGVQWASFRHPALTMSHPVQAAITHDQYLITACATKLTNIDIK